MGLPAARRAEEDHVLLAVEEVELAEVLDHLLLDRALEGEVELLERLASGEPLAELRHRAGGRRRLHRPEQVRELSRSAHAISRS